VWSRETHHVISVNLVVNSRPSAIGCSSRSQTSR
jgi:hypothetical protein